MGELAGVAIRRSNEVVYIHNAELARDYLSPKPVPGFDDCVAKLHKEALARLEGVSDRSYSGIGQAVGDLRHRFAEADNGALSSARSLGQAFACVRHLSWIEQEVWLNRLDNTSHALVLLE